MFEPAIRHAPQALAKGLELGPLLDRVLDPEFGLIRYISEVPVQSGEPDIFIAVAEFANPLETPPRADISRARMINRQSAGAGLDRLSTLWATVGEGLERYAGMIYSNDDIVRARASDLDAESCITPDQFILFTPEQYAQTGFPFSRFDPEMPIGWTVGRRLGDGRKVMLPAALVYMGYESQDRREVLADVYSTGLAIGPDEEWAAATALREAIERDCFGLHWATRTSPRRIDLDPFLDRMDPALARLCRHEGVDLFVGDMTTELGVPGIISVVRPRNHPGLALGASCHPCAAQALEKAVIESFHTYNWLVEMRRWPKDVEPHTVRDFADHVRLYMSDTPMFDASFLWTGTERSTLFDDPAAFGTPTPAQQIATMRAALTARGHKAYLVDVTPADIADLGLRAMRAVTPSLQPIWAGSGRAGLDRRRIDQFLAATGRPLDTPINVDPHPFP